MLKEDYYNLNRRCMNNIRRISNERGSYYYELKWWKEVLINWIKFKIYRFIDTKDYIAVSDTIATDNWGRMSLIISHVQFKWLDRYVLCSIGRNSPNNYLTWLRKTISYKRELKRMEEEINEDIPELEDFWQKSYMDHRYNIKTFSIKYIEEFWKYFYANNGTWYWSFFYKWYNHNIAWMPIKKIPNDKQLRTSFKEIKIILW